MLSYCLYIKNLKQNQVAWALVVNRRKEYGTIVSQLDEIYHNGIDAWKARLANIKAKYPKE